jgi:pimeloyl-ACP methyl ester carboxylesterase
MPTAVCDGIETYYELHGAGPPLLLLSPGGFNATVENWSSFGIHQRLGLLEELSGRFTCIAFDKRESGRSGGRVERIGWEDYARQAAALLDALELERVDVMGGCIGCSIAVTLAAEQPARATKLVLYSPAGGPRYRLTQLARFAEHAAFAREHGPAGVVGLVGEGDATFAQDPRVGPWASVLRSDPAFAAAYAERDAGEYAQLVMHMGAQLFDRDTVPGPEAEALMELDLPALVVPGNDPNHALSAARYLEECLPQSQYWDVMPDAQTAANAPQRILEFLEE